MDRDAFLRAIADNPDDLTARLVFADWLEERGAAGEAAAYRASCEPTVLVEPGEDGWELAVAAPRDGGEARSEPELLGVYPTRDAALAAFLRWHQDGCGVMCPECRGTGVSAEGETDPKGFPVEQECEGCGGACWLGACDEPGCRKLGFPVYPEGSDLPAGQFCHRHRMRHGYCAACGRLIDRLTAVDHAGMCEECCWRSENPDYPDDDEEDEDGSDG